MVLAATHYNDPLKLAEISENLGEAMVGINTEDIVVKYADREAGNIQKTDPGHKTKKAAAGVW